MRADKTAPGLKIEDFEDRSLLIVDDDDPFRDRLSRALEKKGFKVNSAKTVGLKIEYFASFFAKEFEYYAIDISS